MRTRLLKFVGLTLYVVAVSLIVAVLWGCHSATGPDAAPCHWHYTAYTLDVGSGTLTPTDSVLRCRHRDQG